MPSSIPASIGRKVWCYEGPDTQAADPLQPFDATIIFVHPDGTVNLDVVGHYGGHRLFQNVDLRDPQLGDQHGVEVYATWMPYQIAQATANPPASTPAPAP